MRHLRHIALIVGLTAGLFAALELAVARFWSQVPETVTANGEALAIRDAVLGHRYRPNARARHTGPEFAVEYVINADGLRDLTESASFPPDSVTRLLLLGDSFTFGQGVANDANWPTLLQRDLRTGGFAVDVVNAGVQGYSTRQEVLLLEQVVARYEPDVVMLVFLPNDLYANTALEDSMPPEAAEVQSRAGGISRAGGGLQTVMLAQRMLAASDWMYMRLYLLTPWAQYYERPPNAQLMEKLRVTMELLRHANRFSRANGAAFAVLSVPQQFQVLAAAHGFRRPTIDGRVIDEQLDALAAAEGIPWIETLEGFSARYRSSRDNLYFRFDGHLNERGHRLLADMVRDAFLEQFGETVPRLSTQHAAR